MPIKIIDAIGPKGAAVRVTKGLGDRLGLDTYKPGNRRTAADFYMDVSGPALRDALLEAFPLEDGQTVPGSEKGEPEFLDVVPGMVIVDRNRDGGYRRVTLPDGRYYNYEVGVFGAWTYRAPRAEDYKVAFDPRDAVALPSPLGIRVGDRVRKTKDGVTISFKVGHIDGTTGHLSPKGSNPDWDTYNPKEFTVTSREVPNRLPAGTIVRWVRHPERLRLITADGGIYLADGTQGPQPDKSDYDRMVRSGAYEVIYLPES